MGGVTIAKQADPGLEDKVESLARYDGGTRTRLHMALTLEWCPRRQCELRVPSSASSLSSEGSRLSSARPLCVSRTPVFGDWFGTN